MCVFHWLVSQDHCYKGVEYLDDQFSGYRLLLVLHYRRGAVSGPAGKTSSRL